MIIHTGQVLKIDEWTLLRENYIKFMRDQVTRTAQRRDLVMVGPEEIHIVEIRHNGKEWVSAKGENITHVKVTLQQTVEHA